MQRAVLAALLGLMSGLASAQTPPRLPAPQLQIPGFDYRAQTSAPARRQGNISAGGVTWTCAASACTTRRLWERPTVETCRALAAEVGPITSFGRAGATLSATELQQCNASMALQRAPIQITPPAAQLAQTGSGPATITSAELSFVGGGMTATSDRSAPAVAVNASELSFVGGVMVDTSDRDAPPIVATTPELSFVGR